MKNKMGCYDMIWVLNKPKEWKLPEGVTAVKNRSFLYFFYHMTAKVIVTNMTDDVFIPKRKEQILINTWHAGGAYKKVGLSYEKLNSKLSFWQDETLRRETSFYISSSELFTKYNILEAYRYEGEVICSGLPRNDIFFDKNQLHAIRHKVMKTFDAENKKIILYAPTFRGDFGSGKETESVFPFEAVSEAFRQAGQDIIILNRSHYSVTSKYEVKDSMIKDATDYPDMQELLIAADILVTDYSSSIWDFSLMGKPCILFVPDKDEYLAERGTYTPMEKWPGMIAVTKEDLVKYLLVPDIEYCKNKAKESLEYFGSYEKGNATQQVCDIIIKECDK